MKSAEEWAEHVVNELIGLYDYPNLPEFIRAIQRDALEAAAETADTINRPTLSLHAGEFTLAEWRAAKAALAVATMLIRKLAQGGGGVGGE